MSTHEAHTADELDHHSPEEIKRHVRGYMFVFGTLMVLTVVTVAASYLDLPIWLAIAVAMAIACVKGGLVMAYFMHLISEKSLIFYTLYLTAIFFLLLLLIPWFADLNQKLI